VVLIHLSALQTAQSPNQRSACNQIHDELEWKNPPRPCLTEDHLVPCKLGLLLGISSRAVEKQRGAAALFADGLPSVARSEWLVSDIALSESPASSGTTAEL
jgi:hypothetical protein